MPHLLKMKMHEVYLSRARQFICRSHSQKSSETNHQNNYSSSLLESLNINKTIDSLKRDGFFLGINLSQDTVQQIHQFAMHTPCYGNSDNNLGFYYSEKEQAQAKYGQCFASSSYLNAELLCPTIQKIESDPNLLEVSAKYLKAEPVYQGHQLWWSFPVESTLYERRRAAQIFRYHQHESRLLKFYFYITDVDLCSSPHVCVRTSHVKKKLSHRRLQRGLSYQEISKYYGYENIIPICGKAGLGFVEDTLCFHEETPPGSRDRLTLEVTFSHR